MFTSRFWKDSAAVVGYDAATSAHCANYLVSVYIYSIHIILTIIMHTFLCSLLLPPPTSTKNVFQGEGFQLMRLPHSAFDNSKWEARQIWDAFLPEIWRINQTASIRLWNLLPWSLIEFEKSNVEKLKCPKSIAFHLSKLRDNGKVGQ